MLDFETVVGMYVQMETFEQGGVLPSLLIGGVGKAIRLHLAGKGLKTDPNISVFQQTLHSESLQPINHVRTAGFKLFRTSFFPSPPFCFANGAPCFYLHPPHLNSEEHGPIYTPSPSSMHAARRNSS